MKIRFYTLIFLFGWVQDEAHGSCSTENMDSNKELQFCSGSMITGNTIVLSTEGASSKITNCTCHFTVTNNTFVHIAVIRNCTKNIYHTFLNLQDGKNECENILQHMSTTQVLQFVYINDGNSADIYCKQLKTNSTDIELKGSCFADSLNPTVKSPTGSHATTNTKGTTTTLKTTTASTTTASTTKTTAASTTNTTAASTTKRAATTTTTASTTKTTAASTTNAIAETTATTTTTTIKTTHIFDSTTNSSTIDSSKYQDSLQLVTIILVSIVAIASTLVIIILAFCLRNRRLKKQENSRSRSAASNPSFNQADDSGDEMVYNELYHSRNVNRGHVVSAFSDYEDVTPYGPASVVSNDSGIQSQNGNPSACAVSVETHNQNEVKKNGEPIYAVPDKKKKKNKEGIASSYVYAQPERKNKEKRPVTKTRPEKETQPETETRPEKETQPEKETRPAAGLEDFQFDFTNDEENSMHW